MTISAHVHLAEPITVAIPGELTCGMTDRVVRVAPLREAGIDVVFVGVDHRAFAERRLDERTDGRLLDIGLHADDDLAAPLDHPEDRRLLLGQRAPPRRPLQSPAASESPFFLTAAGCPL